LAQTGNNFWLIKKPKKVILVLCHVF